MNKPILVQVFGLIAASAFLFLAAAAVHFRLLPFLEADTIVLRGGEPMPTEQFVSIAVPVLVVLGCLSVVGTAAWVYFARRKAPSS